MMFDRPEVILIFSIAQECLCTARNYTRFGSLFVKLYHNRCSSAAYCYVLLLLLLYCCNNNIIIISPSLKANRKFMHTIAVDRRRGRHWSSATDGQRLYNNNITCVRVYTVCATVINVFSDVLLITRHVEDRTTLLYSCKSWHL